MSESGVQGDWLMYAIRGVEGDDVNSMLYTLTELVAATGLKAPTIRYYTTAGLLPPPDMRRKSALYTEEHLHRLKLVVRLKEAFLPLNTIVNYVEDLSHTEVLALIGEEPLLTEAQAESKTNARCREIARILENRRLLNSRRAVSNPVSPTSAPTPSNRRQEAVRPRESGQRVTLAPGLELYVATPASPSTQTLVRKLQEAARQHPE
ncbi:MAG: MerR family transcriptional regulator [Armatimonadetes bacterium]|nr:MerR family transcriptional regulator [Armatimonadota bacterium]